MMCMQMNIIKITYTSQTGGDRKFNEEQVKHLSKKLILYKLITTICRYHYYYLWSYFKSKSIIFLKITEVYRLRRENIKCKFQNQIRIIRGKNHLKWVNTPFRLNSKILQYRIYN